MKKLFLLLAFTGIVGASSAISISALTKGTVIVHKGDEKKKTDKKKACCKKDAKGTAASDEKTEGKTCTHKGKSCCHAKAEAGSTVTPAKK